MSGNMCDTCVNYVYDEDDESWVCCVDMDEDDYVRMLTCGIRCNCRIRMGERAGSEADRSRADRKVLRTSHGEAGMPRRS